MTVLSWQVFAKEAPDIAEFGESRLDGKVAYLATIRADGFPRTHPVTPVVGEGGCFIFAEPESTKVKDFQANAKFCLHCAMSDSSGSSGEFKITGRAERVLDQKTRALAETICSYRPASRYVLYELKISEAVATRYRGGRPDRMRWIATKELA